MNQHLNFICGTSKNFFFVMENLKEYLEKHGFYCEIYDATNSNGWLSAGGWVGHLYQGEERLGSVSCSTKEAVERKLFNWVESCEIRILPE